MTEHLKTAAPCSSTMVSQEALRYFHYDPSVGGCVFAFVAYIAISVVIGYQTCTIRNTSGRRTHVMWIAVFTGAIEVTFLT